MISTKSSSFLLLLAGGMVFTNGCSSHEESKDENIANVIFFLANDQRHDAPGCYGHPIIQSPNLDHDYEFLHDLKKDPHQLQNFVSNPEYEEILNELRSLCMEKAEYYEEKALQIARK